MSPFVNQNLVVNFFNLIYFGLLTFSLVILVIYHQLGQSFRLFSYISSCILDFLFLFFFFFLLLIFMGLKVSNNRCPFFVMFTKQNLIKVLHSELVMKKCMSVLLDNPPILEFQRIYFFFLNWFIFTADLPFFKFQKNFNKPLCFLKIGLFSRAT
jgi:hypothetical protein